MNPELPFGGSGFRYTRAEALRDGVLHDITGVAAECADLQVPAALTQGLWRALAGNAPFNPKDPRLRELCYGFAFAAAGLTPGGWAGRKDGGEFAFRFRQGACWMHARLLVSPGDQGEPVVTFTLPRDD